MPGEVNLKPCPFCGGKASIEDAGCETYFISCTLCDTIVGDGGNLEKGVAKWNLRSPEPGTSFIRWTRYDGTPETLPELGTVTVGVSAMCVVQRVACKYTVVANLYDPGDGDLLWDCGENGDSDAVEDGDLWAYLPDPPEGMK